MNKIEFQSDEFVYEDEPEITCVSPSDMDYDTKARCYPESGPTPECPPRCRPYCNPSNCIPYCMPSRCKP